MSDTTTVPECSGLRCLTMSLALSALAMAIGAPAAAQGIFKLGVSVDDRVLRDAGEMPLRDVLRRGLVVTYDGERALPVRYVGLLFRDGRVVDRFVSDVVRLEPGRNRVPDDQFARGDQFVPGDQLVAGDQFVPGDRFVPGGQFAATRDVGSLFDKAMPKIDMPRRGFLFAAVAADERLAERVRVRPLLVRLDGDLGRR